MVCPQVSNAAFVIHTSLDYITVVVGRGGGGGGGGESLGFLNFHNLRVNVCTRQHKVAFHTAIMYIHCWQH